MSTPEPRPTFTKLCRKCSTQAETSGDYCPNCGKSYLRRSMSLSSRRAKIVAGLLVLAIVTLAVVAAIAHHGNVKEEKAATAQALEARAEEAREEGRQRTARQEHIVEMEKAITKAAKEDVAKGNLQGPTIKYTSCDPLGGGSSDDLLEAITTTFTCLAVNEENDDDTVSGYSYSATMNWTKGTYSWQLE